MDTAPFPKVSPAAKPTAQWRDTWRRNLEGTILFFAPVLLLTTLALNLFILANWAIMYINMEELGMGMVFYPQRMRTIMILESLNSMINFSALYFYFAQFAKDKWFRQHFPISSLFLIALSSAVAALSWQGDFTFLVWVPCTSSVATQSQAWAFVYSGCNLSNGLESYIASVTWGPVTICGINFVMTSVLYFSPSIFLDSALAIFLDDILFALTSPVWLLFDLIIWVTVLIFLRQREGKGSRLSMIDLDTRTSFSWLFVTGRLKNDWVKWKSRELKHAIKWEYFMLSVKLGGKRLSKGELDNEEGGSVGMTEVF